jgi:hypothetical protein
MSVFERIAAALNPQKSGQQNADSAPPAQNSQQQSAQTGQQSVIQQTQQNAGKDGAPTTATSTAQDDMAKIWDTTPSASLSDSRVFTPNMEQFNEAVSRMDFTRGADPQLAQKALQGDTAALAELLNAVGRGAYSQSTQAATQLIESALQKRTADLDKLIDQRFNSLHAQTQVQQQNAAFRDPQIAPLLKSIQSRLQAQFPEATADDLAGRAQKFLVGIAQKIVEGTPEAQQRAKEKQTTESASQEFDWLSWGAQDGVTPGSPLQ